MEFSAWTSFKIKEIILSNDTNTQSSFSTSASFVIEDKVINIIYTYMLCMPIMQQGSVSTPTLNLVILLLYRKKKYKS